MSEYGTGMGIGNKLVFDVNGNVEDFTFVLSQKNLNHLGQIQNIERESIDHKGNLNSASEISFVVYKSMNGKDERLWDEIIDFRLVWVRELNKYFQMHISLDDSNDTYKTVTCMSLCEAELSELNVTLEVNNTNDPNWNTSLDEYKKTVFCDVNNKDVSLLHRIIADKAPHYTIGHVDSSLMKLQRSFSFKDTSIYDVFVNQVAKEFNCIFIFDSSNRTINAYDLLTTCNNANCNYRDNDYEFYDNQNNHVCPKCGHTSLSYFGTDTTIFVDNEQLGESIKLEIDEGSVKNCFKLVAGDNTITSLVRELNMNGSDRIYNFPPEQIIDMSDELVEKMNAYNTLYSSKEEEYEQTIVDINEAYDKINYYSNTMMPTVEHSEVTSKTEGEKLTVENLSPLGVVDLSAATQSIVENYLLSYAKVYVKTGYVKLEIKTNSWSKTSTKGTWNGYFIVTNYSDEEDVYTTGNLTITVNDDYEEFLNQKLKKSISSSSDEESVLDVLSIDNLNKFKEALTLYCRERLLFFQSAINGAILVLVEQNQSSKDSELYDDLYLPYNEKLKACDAEISIRESQIKQWQDALKHLQDNKTGIQSVLNFKTYLGDELYKEFCSFVREQTYENSNYVSDNLTDSEQIELAKEFISKAKKELVKSSNYQHSISTTLNNLLLIPEFKPILHYFELGNFIRVKVDNYIYRLRLISYHLSFSNLNTLDVTFSDVTKQRNVEDDLNDIINSVNSMSGSYNYVSQQANKGEIANKSFEQMYKEGLNSALVRIKSNNNEDFVIDEHGILGRQFDDITGEYDPEQFRATHNLICFTTDNWDSVVCALGKHDYYKFVDGNLEKYTDFGLSSNFVTSGVVISSQVIGGEIYSTNYSPITGTYINLEDGSFNFGHKIVYDAISNNMTMKGVTISWDSTNPPKTSDIEGLDNHLEQLDGRIQTYSQTNDPSIDWKTSDEKAKHDGDLWFNPNDGLTKRWNNSTGKWEIVTDSELKTLAQSKAHIFTSTPNPPYSVGDLWVEGSNGDIWHCMTSKNKGESFEKNDWLISSKYTDDSSLENFIEVDYSDNLKNIYGQIDKKAETWYQANDPSTEWTTNEIKKIHVGDIWYDTDAEHGKDQTFVYVFKDNKYFWEVMNGVPAEIFDMADGKASMYISKPSNYKKNDMWILDVENANGSNSTYPKYEKGTFLISYKDNSGYSKDDWYELVKYSTNLQDFINGEYAENLKDIGTQIDRKARSWYQSEDPSLTWDKTEDHEGDLWYDTDANSQVTSIYKDGAWKATSVPKSLFDTIDGIASIYVTVPSNPQVGDLLIPTSDVGTYKAGKVYKYNGSTWVEISYTDDTKANEAYNLADSAKGIAENAKTLGNTLKEGLGFETTITGEYVISPVIGGGTLLIGDKNETFAQITTEGKLICTGADISGSIHATDGEFTGKVTATSGEIGGWTIQGLKLMSGTKENECVAVQGIGDNMTWVFAAGSKSHDTYGKSPFRVSKTGSLYSTSGQIGGWTINENFIYNGKMPSVEGSCGIGTYDPEWTFWAGSGDFRVTDSGKVIANNIHANGGCIGGNEGWSIGDKKITSNGFGENNYYKVSLSCPTQYGTIGNGYADVLVIKREDPDGIEYPFVLSSNGDIKSNNWRITQAHLHVESTYTSGGVTKTIWNGMQNALESSNAAFFAGCTVDPSSNQGIIPYSAFYVTHQGHLKANYSEIAGWATNDTQMYQTSTINGINYSSGMQKASNLSNAAFFAGCTNLSMPVSTSNFWVTHDGDLFAKNIKNIVSSSVNITPSAANTPTGVAVSWSLHKTPNVVATPHSKVPGTGVLGVSVEGISTNGCTIYLTRTNSVETAVNYIAIAN